MWRIVNILVGLMSMFVIDAAAISYFLSPKSSEVCKNYIKYGPRQGISVNHQIVVYAGPQESNATEQGMHKMCSPNIFPLGKIVQWALDEGGVMKFWYLRIHVNGQFTDCNSKLVVKEIHTSRTHIDDHETPTKVHTYNCKSNLPTVLHAIYRNLNFQWETEGASSSSVTVQISKYVRFSRNASVQVRRARCLRAQDLFFCNGTNVCIPGSSHCDGNDDCFEGEGGSDEVGCLSDNGTIPRDPNLLHEHSTTWMTNLPWIALGILPVILVFALARICSQKRHLDIGEDYKMGFNTEDEDEGDETGAGATGPRGNRSERSDSPDDAESARSVHEDYNDEGYSLPRHKKTMSASSDYLPANFVELTASPANRARRAENERKFCPATPTKPDPGPASTPQAPQQHVVAVQINNPVYGNNVYVDVPTHAVPKEEYTRPAKQIVMPTLPKERMRNGQEEYTPLLPPLPPGATASDVSSSGDPPGSAFQPAAGLGEGSGQHCSSGASDDYEDEPPPYDDFMTPPPPSTMPPKTLSGEGERPEMLHLKPLLRSGAGSGGSSPKGPAPSAPNGSSTGADRNNRDSDYDKNYIVV